MKRHERSPPGADFAPASHRRRLSFSQSDLNDPGQVKELFDQCLDQVLRGLHPVSRDTAIRLAAIHCFVQFGQHHKGVEQSIRAYKLLPKEYTHGRNVHSREHEKNIIEQYRNQSFADAFAAKQKYCDICRNLPTYGMVFFEVKEPQGNRLIPRLFGVNKECVMSVDKKTKVIRKLWPLEQLRRWAAGPTTFNIDFGDYQDAYYSAQTTEGQRIKRLIAEFVDVIIWKKKLVDPFGLEGDEGAIMLEDFVLRARSVPVTLEDVVEEEWPTITPKMHSAANSTPLIPSFGQQTAPILDLDRFPRTKDSSMPIRSNEIPRQIDRSAALCPLRPPGEPQPLVLPSKPEQYDQLPFQEAPLFTTKITPPTSPLLPQIGPFQIQPMDQLPHGSISPPLPYQCVPLPQAAVGHLLPPSLSTSTGQKAQGAVRPNSMSVLTEQEIVYEISIKDGQAHRSFEQFYSQNRNLQGFAIAIGQSARRIGEISGQLEKEQKQIANLLLTEEQRQMAIQLGEDTIRHRAVLFLAYTAQVVEWTSDFQLHPKFGAAQMAVVQAADNLCELVQCFHELCTLRQNATQLCPLIHSVCTAFIDLMEKLNPEKCEKRSAFLSSASLIGEKTFTLLNALNEEEEAEEDLLFYAGMNEAIQQVANGTADLVIQAKNLPAFSGESQSEKVIESATKVALSTSELIALTRVLSSIMAHPTCQKRVQNATERVRCAIREFIEQAKADAFSQFAVTGTTEHYAKMQKNALMAEMALKQLLEQTVH